MIRVLDKGNSINITLPAISLTSYVQTWLQKTAQARVLHVFERACNLIAADDQIISIVTPSVGNGPFNLVVPTIQLNEYMTSSSQVVVDSSGLRVGKIMIETVAAQLWEPQPNWEQVRFHLPQMQIIIQHLLKKLPTQVPPGSFASLVIPLSSTQSGFERVMLQTARRSARRLLAGIRLGDLQLCCIGAAGLAGLGGGFTPDGDDLILGCMLGSWARYTKDKATAIASLIYQTAAPRTTVLSAAWLRAAADGECAVAWHTLVESLLGDDDKAVFDAANKIIHTGHTSGVSALAGFLGVVYWHSSCNKNQ